jgi:hypothetical protein
VLGGGLSLVLVNNGRLVLLLRSRVAAPAGHRRAAGRQQTGFEGASTAGRRPGGVKAVGGRATSSASCCSSLDESGCGQGAQQGVIAQQGKVWRGGNFVVNMRKSKGRLNNQTDESVWNTFSAVSRSPFYSSNQSIPIRCWNISLFHRLEQLHPIHT